MRRRTEAGVAAAREHGAQRRARAGRGAARMSSIHCHAKTQRSPLARRPIAQTERPEHVAHRPRDHMHRHAREAARGLARDAALRRLADLKFAARRVVAAGRAHADLEDVLAARAARAARFPAACRCGSGARARAARRPPPTGSSSIASDGHRPRPVGPARRPVWAATAPALRDELRVARGRVAAGDRQTQSTHNEWPSCHSLRSVRLELERQPARGAQTKRTPRRLN